MNIADLRGMDLSASGQAADVLQGPTVEHETVNLTGVTGTSYTEPSMTNCRVIYADAEGIVRVGYLNASGEQKTEVLNLQAGSMYPIRKVNRVYGTYNGTNACTSQVYTDAGILVVGLKLRR